MNALVSGFIGKFSEGVGSGLIIAVFTIGAILLANKYIMKNEGILNLSPANYVCERDEQGNNCVVKVDCATDEIAISGQCIVRDSKDKKGVTHPLYLMNF